MSTRADDLLDETKKSIQEAITRLSEVVSDDLLRDWKPSYRDRMPDILRDLVDLRERMRSP